MGRVEGRNSDAGGQRRRISSTHVPNLLVAGGQAGSRLQSGIKEIELNGVRLTLSHTQRQTVRHVVGGAVARNAGLRLFGRLSCVLCVLCVMRAGDIFCALKDTHAHTQWKSMCPSAWVSVARVLRTRTQSRPM